jgi:S-formylglutathione hydrolase FrmB
MKKTLISLAALVLLLQVNSFAQSPAKSSVETVQFQSKLVNAALPYNVILPTDYAEAKTTRYPVLYLLHGLTGHYDNWVSMTQLKEYAARYEMIVVTPEGNNGWYTDSATVPTEKYETYILQEVIPDVQQRYRTIKTRAGRAIGGLSMGGYGALKFGVKHPELFVFIASMSGALGAASWTEADLRGSQVLWRSLVTIYGPADSSVRAANDVHKLYREVPAERLAELPYVYLDCGTEDPLLQSSRSLADLLLARKIQHEYRELPGAHNWTYWNAQVVEVLRIAAAKMSPAQIDVAPYPALRHDGLSSLQTTTDY